MGRLLCERLELSGALVAETPIHAGAREASLLSDLPVALDGAGEPYFPGTGLAGPIRAWWRRAAASLPEPDEIHFGIWGAIEASNSAAETGSASLIEIEDAALSQPCERELRQHVGISRATGAQSPGLKYDRETLPAGARLRFRLRLLRPHASQMSGRAVPHALRQAVQRWDEIRRLFKGMIEALEEGEIRFGAGKARGLGRMKLIERKVVVVRLSSRDGVLAHLDGTKPRDEDPLEDVAAVRPPRADATFALTCALVAPLAQKHDADGTLVDQMPALALVGSDRHAMIAGTGLKGAFRAQSERICRTMAGAPALPDQNAPDDARIADLVGALYGVKAAPPQKGVARRCVEPGLGAVSFEDCQIGGALKRDDWLRIYARAPAGDNRLARMSDALNGTAWSDWRAAALVAIDRWTGGAAEGMLFGRIEPMPPSVTLTARLDVGRIAPPAGCADPEAFTRAALALFLLTLRDFARGRIPVGHGVNRGLGDLSLTTLSADAPKAGALKPFADAVLTPESFSSREAMSAFIGLHDAWRDYWEIAR